MPDRPKHHPIPLSGGDRKALTRELGKCRWQYLSLSSAATRAKAEAKQK